ncbi:histidine phosphatase family protein [Sulfitobacter aestuarii]|uniref:Histidine phosphatase family protein n=1 Tax=Sulfitobacter aestuarii TaxID=2161676 RepID=A0ABW5U3S1_9RHOB
MTTWHWIRHGPTHEKTFVGWRDVPADLSDGAQIARLCALLPERALLLSSDLIRASATADALALPGHRRLPSTKALRELHFGRWDGLHFAEVARRDPELSRAYWETPGDIIAPDGESWNQTAARVNAFVDEMNRAHPAGEIIAVAHFGVILTQIQRALATSPQEAMAHRIDNLSLTRLHHEEDSWRVERINHRA